MGRDVAGGPGIGRAGGPTRDRLRPYVSDLLATWAPDAPQVRDLPGAFLHADVTGFTHLAEQLARLGRAGAELLDMALTRVLSRLVAAARRWDGDILSFGGDAVLVHFGGEDATRRAAVAATEMQRLVAAPIPMIGRVPVSLPVTIGIHTGVATAMRVVTPTQVEAVVLGPTITGALRAEEHAPPRGVLVTARAAADLPASWLAADTPHGVRLAGRLEGPPPPHRHRSGPAAMPIRHLLSAPVVRAASTRRPRRRYQEVVVGFVGAAGIDGILQDQGPGPAHDHVTEVLTTLTEHAGRTGAHVLAVDAQPDAIAMLVCAGSEADGVDDALVGALRASVQELPGRHVSAGAHRGRAYVGGLGAPTRRTYTPLGDTVNVAARLMELARPDELLVTTALASRCEVARTALPPLRVRGKRAGVHACRVGGPATDARPLAATA